MGIGRKAGHGGERWRGEFMERGSRKDNDDAGTLKRLGVVDSGLGSWLVGVGRALYEWI